MVELVGGGSVIKGATPSSLVICKTVDRKDLAGQGL